METAVKILLGIALVLAWALLLTLPVHYLWNILMPELFHLPMITRVQALQLLALSGCLFRS